MKIIHVKMDNKANFFYYSCNKQKSIIFCELFVKLPTVNSNNKTYMSIVDEIS